MACSSIPFMSFLKTEVIFDLIKESPSPSMSIPCSYAASIALVPGLFHRYFFNLPPLLECQPLQTGTCACLVPTARQTVPFIQQIFNKCSK